ncbi:MAG: circadian clock protein KaiC, partial [Candidatus Omnitrophica bacterium]|nr:circadian clock protein KaiC [Candidatus Omnitrophota bacterium]
LLAMEFLYRGAVEFDEPGVFMSFEEKENDLIENFASLGFDLPELMREKKLLMDYVYIERSEIEETGEYDLEGIFVRLGGAIASIGAKRVVLDTLEALFSGFTDQLLLRAELRRLFRWLKEKGVTAIITGEKGEHLLTKHGLEEYVADCVIILDHRVKEQVSTRRLKIVKYRGSKHGTNEFPFLIGDNGIFLFPITSVRMTHAVSDRRVSSGIDGVDSIIEGGGFYAGSVVLVSGTAGSGKTSFISQLSCSACKAGKRVLFFSYEEVPQEINRNMKSIGLDLQKWIDKDHLRFSSNRAYRGLETHLVTALNAVDEFDPDVVVLDPITALIEVGTTDEARAMLTRVIDHLKNMGITVVMTDIMTAAAISKQTMVGISSICDAWLKLDVRRRDREVERTLTILKARGLKHKLSANRLVINDDGLSLDGRIT